MHSQPSTLNWSPSMPRPSGGARRKAAAEATALVEALAAAKSGGNQLGADHTVLPRTLPLLPIRDQVYFPHMIFPLLVGREKSVRALDDAIGHERQIVLVAQREIN